MNESLKFLREIRSSKNLTPFIILIKHGDETGIIEGISQGADLVLPKTDPILLCPALDTAINRYLSQKSISSTWKEVVPESVQSSISSESDYAARYYRVALNAIPLPVFLRNLNGIYLDCNTAFEEFIRINRREIVGKSNYDFFPGEVADHYRHMDELIIENPYVQQYEYSFENHQGVTNNVLISKNVLQIGDGKICGIIGVIHDISERKKFEEIVYASEEKYRTLADYTYDWEALISPERIYRYISPSCERITGYLPIDFISNPDLVINITHPDDREKIQRHYQGGFRQDAGPFQIDYRIISRSGEERWVSHICQSVFRDDGTWIGRRESKRDITFKKEIEKAYLQTNLKLNLLSNITRHDVLNQLSALIGFTEIALEINTHPDIGVMLKRVMSSAMTISDQISFTRTYQDIGIKSPAWQEAYEVIKRATAGVSIESIEIDVALTSLEVLADPLLEKVFFCLLDNSERHGKHVTRSRFSCRDEKDCLIITYEDNGVGIEPHEKDRIFERGYGKNTGFGLFLAKEILTISGESITERGVIGIGALFEIRFGPGSFRRRPST
ncbi:MAG TPA: PAS domain S-box protein [Methanospirillum sp.]|uniref:PAS domain-containing sensor histidine kinase n=1 Tax=Methanospirillum sp. TaxID=45200 RepID=UPI002CBD6C1C|nr:PAS domain S-box protein [Methanospirillum sp.]HWQ63930.1 PAS domain S-box protein [Methanospirillum sp.]